MLPRRTKQTGQEVGMVRKTNQKSRPRHYIFLLLLLIYFYGSFFCWHFFDKTNIFYFVRIGFFFPVAVVPDRHHLDAT
jgi:hypothetical protein